MTHDPKPGEVDYLPGVVFLTCPVCQSTTSWLNPTGLSTTLDCICGTRWTITTTPDYSEWTWTAQPKEAKT